MFSKPNRTGMYATQSSSSPKVRRASNINIMSDRAFGEEASLHNQGSQENDFSKEERDLCPGETLDRNNYRPLLRAPSVLATAEDTAEGLLHHQHCLLGFFMDDR